MKKITNRTILGFLIIATLLAGYVDIMAFGGEEAQGEDILEKTREKNKDECKVANLGNIVPSQEEDQLESHVVFAELGSVSWCPNCPRASEKMDELFSTSTSSSFYYVTLVYDLNDIASKRGRQLSDSYIPMLYIDGGYQVVDETNNYESAIDALSNRDDVHPLTMELTSEWKGDATFDITVSITNMDSRSYLGHLRVHVIEIDSRWEDYSGEAYHNALLDYALDKYLRIPPGDTYAETTTWRGSDSHGGQTYADITQDNIMIIGTISHWVPHLQSNPWTTPRPYRFLAQYVDQTYAVMP